VGTTGCRCSLGIKIRTKHHFIKKGMPQKMRTIVFLRHTVF